MTFANLSLSEVLDDLGSRFIINVPDEELASIERICFQIEQAHWFYEDFVREESPTLPSFSLKAFCAQFFHHCPLLHEWAEVHEEAFATFMKYKFRVPVCGAIILNDTCDHVLLVKGWNSRTWSWPRGKINKGEKELRCAVREVMEETGFDITPYLVTTTHPPTMNRGGGAATSSSGKQKGDAAAETNEPDHMQITIKEQRLRLYIAAGVPTDTVFETRTRKEIAEIAWHPLSSLPGYSKRAGGSGGANAADLAGHYSSSAAGGAKKKYYMLTPFLAALRTWVKKRKQYLKRNGPPVRVGGGSGIGALDVDSEYDTDRSLSMRFTAPTVMPSTASLELKSILGIGGGGGGGGGGIRSGTVETTSVRSSPSKSPQPPRPRTPPSSSSFGIHAPPPASLGGPLMESANDYSPSFSHLLSASNTTSSHLRDLLGTFPGSPPPASTPLEVPLPVSAPIEPSTSMVPSPPGPPALAPQPAVRIWQPKPTPSMFPAASLMAPKATPPSHTIAGDGSKANPLLNAILLGPAPARSPSPPHPEMSPSRARSVSPMSLSSLSRSRSQSPSSGLMPRRDENGVDEEAGAQRPHPWLSFKFDRSKIVACFD